MPTRKVVREQFVAGVELMAQCYVHGQLDLARFHLRQLRDMEVTDSNHAPDGLVEVEKLRFEYARQTYTAIADSLDDAERANYQYPDKNVTG